MAHQNELIVKEWLKKAADDELSITAIFEAATRVKHFVLQKVKKVKT